jgi:hypothetical protein
MANIREISTERISSLTKLSGKPVVLSDIEHMRLFVNDKKCLDLDRSKNNGEYALALRITKDPRRQSIDERLSNGYLKSIYPDIDVSKSTNTHYDAMLKDHGWTIDWCEKGGQNCDGTMQTFQCTNVMNFIREAPDKTSTDKHILAIYVNGDFWTRTNRRKYQGFVMPNGKQFSIIDILKILAHNKKCIIFSDNDLPKPEFYKTYIQGIYEA